MNRNGSQETKIVMWRLTPIQTWQSARDLPDITARLRLTGKGIPNFLVLLAKSSAALNAYVQAEESLANGELTPHQRQKIALAVAEINGSAYCLAVHEKNAREIGLSDAEIQSSRKASANDPKTQAMLHFVQAVVLQRGEISDNDFLAMRKVGFSEAEIIEVLANVGMSIFTNYFNILAQTDLDFPRPTAARGTPSSGNDASDKSRQKQIPVQPLSHQ